MLREEKNEQEIRKHEKEEKRKFVCLFTSRDETVQNYLNT